MQIFRILFKSVVSVQLLLFFYLYRFYSSTRRQYLNRQAFDRQDAKILRKKNINKERLTSTICCTLKVTYTENMQNYFASLQSLKTIIRKINENESC